MLIPAYYAVVNVPHTANAVVSHTVQNPSNCRRSPRQLHPELHHPLPSRPAFLPWKWLHSSRCVASRNDRLPKTVPIARKFFSVKVGEHHLICNVGWVAFCSDKQHTLSYINDMWSAWLFVPHMKTMTSEHSFQNELITLVDVPNCDLRRCVPLKCKRLHWPRMTLILNYFATRNGISCGTQTFFDQSCKGEHTAMKTCPAFVCQREILLKKKDHSS